MNPDAFPLRTKMVIMIITRTAIAINIQGKYSEIIPLLFFIIKKAGRN
jgi:hypothetical protein